MRQFLQTIGGLAIFVAVAPSGFGLGAEPSGLYVACSQTGPVNVQIFTFIERSCSPPCQQKGIVNIQFLVLSDVSCGQSGTLNVYCEDGNCRLNRRH